MLYYKYQCVYNYVDTTSIYNKYKGYTMCDIEITRNDKNWIYDIENMLDGETVLLDDAIQILADESCWVVKTHYNDGVFKTSEITTLLTYITQI